MGAAGFTPHKAQRRLGGAGLLSPMYETQYGGASVEALANLVFVGALSAMGHACPELDLPWMLQAEVSQRP